MPFYRKLFGRLRGRGMGVLVVLLVVTVGLTLWLGSQALAAARSHRRTAEGILRDYARIAAWEYSRRVRDGLDRFSWELFDEVPRRIRQREAPLPEVMGWELDDALRRSRCRCRQLQEETVFFRWSVVDSTTVIRGNTPPFPPERGLTRYLNLSADSAVDHRYGYFAVPAGDLSPEPAFAGYAISTGTDGRGRFVYGFSSPLSAVEELFAGWYRRQGLLPEVVAGTRPNDSILHLAVGTPGGDPVFESRAASSTGFLAHNQLPPEYGSLSIRVAIRPDAAQHLVTGGLPPSRLPVLLVLMVLAVGVGVAALFLIRREQHLAALRDDFISGVSHEFRTPLTQIRMFTDLLADGKLRTGAERHRSTEVIRREARRLSHLVENILQFSRSRRGPARGQVREEVFLEPAIRDLVDGFLPLAQARDSVLAADVEDGLWVAVERGHLHQMLGNLLDNALKYGPEEQTVRLEARAIGEEVRIAVEDQGPGIPRKDRGAVWDPYLRLERDVEGPVRGSGIGLSVVEDLAMGYGGRAWVEDGAGGGARFVVELPGGRRGEEEPSSVPGAMEEPAATGPDLEGG